MDQIEQLAEAALQRDSLRLRSLVQDMTRAKTDWSTLPRPKTKDVRLLAIAASLAELLATRQNQSPPAWTKEIGALTVGRRADLIQVSLSDLHFTPMYDVISHLIYVADEQDVTTVVVDGRVLKRDGKVLTVDEARVRKEADAIAARIRAEVIDKKSPGQ